MMELKKELLGIIEYCKLIGADARAKKVATEMWKNKITIYINNVTDVLDKCRLHGLYSMISSYENTNLKRDMFFDYMREVIERWCVINE